MATVPIQNDTRNAFELAPSPGELRALRAMSSTEFTREAERRGVRPFGNAGAIVTHAGENTAALRLVLRERAR